MSLATHDIARMMDASAVRADAVGLGRRAPLVPVASQSD